MPEKGLEIDTQKHDSTCQVAACSEPIVSWQVLCLYELTTSPFVTVGLCKGHLDVLKKLTREEGDRHD